METALLAGVFGIAGVVVGSFLQQRFSAKEAERHFERQRTLAREQHEREMNATFNRELSAKLDEALLWGDAVRTASQQIGLSLPAMADRDARVSAISEVVLNWFGIKELGALFMSAELFEDDELKDAAREHIIKARELFFLLREAGSPAFSASRLSELEGVIEELRRRIDLRRRSLLREAKPL